AGWTRRTSGTRSNAGAVPAAGGRGEREGEIMGSRTSGYGWICDPSFGGVLSFLVQQERPDGSLWSVTVYLDDLEQARESYATEAEARAAGCRRLEESHA